MYDFSQSTVPGCRTPHLWLRDGRSLYDALGPDFTLLRFDPAVEVGGLLAAAAKHGLPMTVLDVDGNEAAGAYPPKLLLSHHYLPMDRLERLPALAPVSPCRPG